MSYPASWHEPSLHVSNGPPIALSWCGKSTPLFSVVGGEGWQLVHEPVKGVEWHLTHPSLSWACTNVIDECASMVNVVDVFFICIDMLNPIVKITKHNASNIIFFEVNFSFMVSSGSLL